MRINRAADQPRTRADKRSKCMIRLLKQMCCLHNGRCQDKNDSMMQSNLGKVSHLNAAQWMQSCSSPYLITLTKVLRSASD
jgi:hypothetical protein